jgi:hypothetical protein
MSTLRQVKAAAAKIGAIVEDDKVGHTHECTVEAPPGYRWRADELHQFVNASYIPWKPDYADLLDRMADGIEPCPDPDCDWCHPEEDA